MIYSVVFKRAKNVFTWLIIGIFYMVNANAENDKSKNELTFGVFPYVAPQVVEKIYGPIGVAFSKILNRKVRFLTSTSYSKFNENLHSQMYDIVFVQPFDYVEIADKYGYKPLAMRDKRLPAILVIRSDSQIKSVADLNGKTIGLPPKTAVISYMTKIYLEKKGFVQNRNIKYVYFRSHFSCMHNVLVNTVDVCGTAPPALRVFKASVLQKLSVIAKTPTISNLLFAVHPRVSAEEIARLKSAILSWKNSNNGKIFLSATKVNAYIDAKDFYYDQVREMLKKNKAYMQ